MSPEKRNRPRYSRNAHRTRATEHTPAPRRRTPSPAPSRAPDPVRPPPATAVAGQVAHEQFEHRSLVHPASQIARGHRQLVLVGQQRCLRRRQQSRVVRIRRPTAPSHACARLMSRSCRLVPGQDEQHDLAGSLSSAPRSPRCSAASLPLPRPPASITRAGVAARAAGSGAMCASCFDVLPWISRRSGLAPRADDQQIERRAVERELLGGLAVCWWPRRHRGRDPVPRLVTSAAPSSLNGDTPASNGLCSRSDTASKPRALRRVPAASRPRARARARSRASRCNRRRSRAWRPALASSWSGRSRSHTARR